MNFSDTERVKSEKVLPPQLKRLLKLGEYGAFRFGCYIVQYSYYSTVNEFIKQATIDEWVEIERAYLDDWETRKYSLPFQITIPNILEMNIKEENMKKLLKEDIKDFYRFYNIEE